MTKREEWVARYGEAISKVDWDAVAEKWSSRETQELMVKNYSVKGINPDLVKKYKIGIKLAAYKPPNKDNMIKGYARFVTKDLEEDAQA